MKYIHIVKTSMLFLPAQLYRSILFLRNAIYVKKAQKFSDKKLIGIGNISMGGTGKTPLTEFIANKFYLNKKICILSRGYKRKTKGLIEVNEKENVYSVGDEMFQMFLKLKEKVKLYVGENRIKAIKKILEKNPFIDTFLLDDAFQQTKIKFDCQILLTQYAVPFFKNHPLPWGTLRESRKGAKRAHIILVTKCPEKIKNKEYYKKQIYKYTHPFTPPVFFTKISYQAPKNIFTQNKSSITTHSIVFTGIANEKPFIAFLKTHTQIVKQITFGDHFSYSTKEVLKLKKYYEMYKTTIPNICLITTEKDAVKLQTPLFKKHLEHLPILYFPIKTSFEEEPRFLNILKKFID